MTTLYHLCKRLLAQHGLSNLEGRGTRLMRDPQDGKKATLIVQLADGRELREEYDSLPPLEDERGA